MIFKEFYILLWFLFFVYYSQLIFFFLLPYLFIFLAILPFSFSQKFTKLLNFCFILFVYFFVIYHFIRFHYFSFFFSLLCFCPIFSLFSLKNWLFLEIEPINLQQLIFFFYEYFFFYNFYFFDVLEKLLGSAPLFSQKKKRKGGFT